MSLQLSFISLHSTQYRSMFWWKKERQLDDTLEAIWDRVVVVCLYGSEARLTPPLHSSWLYSHRPSGWCLAQPAPFPAQTQSLHSRLWRGFYKAPWDIFFRKREVPLFYGTFLNNAIVYFVWIFICKYFWSMNNITRYM